MSTYGRTMALAVRHFWENGVQCPCGARPESPDTHGHVAGCPVGAALERIDDDASFNVWDLQMPPGTVADEFNASYWPGLLVDPDGEFDIIQAKAELLDYSDLMREASKVYMDVTGSMISKPNTAADAVIRVHEERCPVAEDARTERRLLSGLMEQMLQVLDQLPDLINCTPEQIALIATAGRATAGIVREVLEEIDA